MNFKVGKMGIKGSKTCKTYKWNKRNYGQKGGNQQKVKAEERPQVMTLPSVGLMASGKVSHGRDQPGWGWATKTASILFSCTCKTKNQGYHGNVAKPRNCGGNEFLWKENWSESCPLCRCCHWFTAEINTLAGLYINCGLNKRQRGFVGNGVALGLFQHDWTDPRQVMTTAPNLVLDPEIISQKQSCR